MSVWCGVDGTIKTRKYAHVSLRTTILEMFDECSKPYVNVVIDGEDYTVQEVGFSFCSDGLQAAKCVSAFIHKLKEMDKTCQADLTASVRFFA